MSEQLDLGTIAERKRSLSQWYTPPELAQRIVNEFEDLFVGRCVLEPSAGDGALVEPLFGVASKVHAIELDPSQAAYIMSDCTVDETAVTVTTGDFLKLPRFAKRYDVALMNPPFENGQDVAFVMKALEWCGEVVSILRLKALAGVRRKAELWDRVELARLCILSRRPAFSGQKGAMADFVVAHLRRPAHPIPSRPWVEWW